VHVLENHDGWTTSAGKIVDKRRKEFMSRDRRAQALGCPSAQCRCDIDERSKGRGRSERITAASEEISMPALALCERLE
jgi:hypothetical protein